MPSDACLCVIRQSLRHGKVYRLAKPTHDIGMLNICKRYAGNYVFHSNRRRSACQIYIKLYFGSGALYREDDIIAKRPVSHIREVD